MLVTNNHGVFTITGQLADGAPINQTTPITEGYFLPLFANPYNKTGLLHGWLDFGVYRGPAAPTNYNELVWIKKAAKTGLYRDGFTNHSVIVEGSIWTNEPATLFMPSPLTLQVFGGPLPVPQVIAVSFDASGALSKLSPGGVVAGGIKLKSGLITIGFGTPTTLGYGTYLQTQQAGGGFFLGTATAGGLTLKP